MTGGEKMKTAKTYRFSPHTISILDHLKDYSKNWTGKWTETDIIEHAISCLFVDVKNRRGHTPV